jgi:hypothetical protein
VKVCRKCGSPNHTGFHCYIGRKPLKTTATLKATKPMKKIGKVGRATMASNKEFLDSFADDELYCFYCMFIGIEELLERKCANAEHFYSRARHPELRLDKSKLVIACTPHNAEKGSLDGPEFLIKLKESHDKRQTEPDNHTV